MQNPRQSWLVATIINTEILLQCLHFLKPYLANADRLLIERCYIATLIDRMKHGTSILPKTIFRAQSML